MAAALAATTHLRRVSFADVQPLVVLRALGNVARPLAYLSVRLSASLIVALGSAVRDTGSRRSSLRASHLHVAFDDDGAGGTDDNRRSMMRIFWDAIRSDPDVRHLSVDGEVDGAECGFRPPPPQDGALDSTVAAGLLRRTVWVRWASSSTIRALRFLTGGI